MRAMPTDEGDDVVNKWALIVLSLFVVAFLEPQASVASFHQSAAPVSDTNAITGQNDEAKTLRYRSGRRYYNPTPNYRAPVRTTPRTKLQLLLEERADFLEESVPFLQVRS